MNGFGSRMHGDPRYKAESAEKWEAGLRAHLEAAHGLRRIADAPAHRCPGCRELIEKIRAAKENPPTEADVYKGKNSTCLKCGKRRATNVYGRCRSCQAISAVRR
jgi:uncharacterized protein with PIN domain